MARESEFAIIKIGPGLMFPNFEELFQKAERGKWENDTSREPDIHANVEKT